MYFDEEEKRCDRVTFTNRLIIEKKFEEWCDKNSISKTPNYRVEEYAEGWACPVCDMGVTIDHGRTRNSYCSNCG